LTSDPFAFWEESFEEIIPDVINVKELDNLSLLDIFKEQRDILLSLREVLMPLTQEGRDAHSLYGACKIELKRRGLL
jgi:hypothetical protein